MADTYELEYKKIHNTLSKDAAPNTFGYKIGQRVSNLLMPTVLDAKHLMDSETYYDSWCNIYTNMITYNRKYKAYYYKDPTDYFYVYDDSVVDSETFATSLALHGALYANTTLNEKAWRDNADTTQALSYDFLDTNNIVHNSYPAAQQYHKSAELMGYNQYHVVNSDFYTPDVSAGNSKNRSYNKNYKANWYINTPNGLFFPWTLCLLTDSDLQDIQERGINDDRLKRDLRTAFSPDKYGDEVNYIYGLNANHTLISHKISLEENTDYVFQLVNRYNSWPSNAHIYLQFVIENEAYSYNNIKLPYCQPAFDPILLNPINPSIAIKFHTPQLTSGQYFIPPRLDGTYQLRLRNVQTPRLYAIIYITNIDGLDAENPYIYENSNRYYLKEYSFFLFKSEQSYELDEKGTVLSYQSLQTRSISAPSCVSVRTIRSVMNDVRPILNRTKPILTPYDSGGDAEDPYLEVKFAPDIVFRSATDFESYFVEMNDLYYVTRDETTGRPTLFKSIYDDLNENYYYFNNSTHTWETGWNYNKFTEALANYGSVLFKTSSTGEESIAGYAADREFCISDTYDTTDIIEILYGEGYEVVLVPYRDQLLSVSRDRQWDKVKITTPQVYTNVRFIDSTNLNSGRKMTVRTDTSTSFLDFKFAPNIDVKKHEIKIPDEPVIHGTGWTRVSYYKPYKESLLSSGNLQNFSTSDWSTVLDDHPYVSATPTRSHPVDVPETYTDFHALTYTTSQWGHHDNFVHTLPLTIQVNSTFADLINLKEWAQGHTTITTSSGTQTAYPTVVIETTSSKYIPYVNIGVFRFPLFYSNSEKPETFSDEDFKIKFYLRPAAATLAYRPVLEAVTRRFNEYSGTNIGNTSVEATGWNNKSFDDLTWWELNFTKNMTASSVNIGDCYINYNDSSELVQKPMIGYDGATTHNSLKTWYYKADGKRQMTHPKGLQYSYRSFDVHHEFKHGFLYNYERSFLPWFSRLRGSYRYINFTNTVDNHTYAKGSLVGLCFRWGLLNTKKFEERARKDKRVIPEGEILTVYGDRFGLWGRKDLHGILIQENEIYNFPMSRTIFVSKFLGQYPSNVNDIDYYEATDSNTYVQYVGTSVTYAVPGRLYDSTLHKTTAKNTIHTQDLKSFCWGSGKFSTVRAQCTKSSNTFSFDTLVIDDYWERDKI